MGGTILNNKRLSLLLFLIIVFVSIMSVNAADAGNSSNSNFHKIQILKTLLITIQIIIKATIILIKMIILI